MDWIEFFPVFPDGLRSPRSTQLSLGTYIGYVQGSPNGKICKSTNGTVGAIFTNGNQKTLNDFCCQVPLVPPSVNKPPSVHVLGDFNFGDIVWPDRHNKCGSPLSRIEGQIFVDIINDHGFDQLEILWT